MCHGYHIWSKELLMQVKNDDDLHGGERSSVVKCGKLCYQTWSEEQLMQLGNRMPYLDDIWYVGRARAKGAHGDLDGGQRSSEVKWGKLCAMATIFGQKKR